MESPGTISLLFSLDIDIALQTIFMNLDPHSLKQSRLVCRQWAQFIKDRVVPKYKDILHFQWRHATPSVRSLHLEGVIDSLSCDDTIVVCGMRDGKAKVYEIATFKLLKVLNCKPEKSLLSRITSLKRDLFKYYHVLSDTGTDIVATVSQKTCLSIWKRADWSNVYKKVHFRKPSIGKQSVVKVLPNMIIFLAEYCVDVLSWDGDKAVLLKSTDDPSFSVPIFKWCQYGDYIAIIKDPYIAFIKDPKDILYEERDMYYLRLELWSLESNTRILDVDATRMYSVTLSYPFIIYSERISKAYLNYETGIFTLNLLTGDKVRISKFKTDLMFTARNGFMVLYYTRKIHRSGLIKMGDYYEGEKVVLYNLKEITSSDKNENVWTREKYVTSRTSRCMDVNVCLNSSCLVTSEDSKLYVWNFFNSDEYNDLDSWALSMLLKIEPSALENDSDDSIVENEAN